MHRPSWGLLAQLGTAAADFLLTALGGRAPWWAPWLLYEVAAAGGVLLVVGALLTSQLAYVLRGESYIDSLQAKA